MRSGKLFGIGHNIFWDWFDLLGDKIITYFDEIWDLLSQLADLLFFSAKMRIVMGNSMFLFHPHLGNIGPDLWVYSWL